MAAPISKPFSLEDTALPCATVRLGIRWDGRVYPDFNDWERLDDGEDNIILLGLTHCRLVEISNRS